jgi:hypothetical protein
MGENEGGVIIGPANGRDVRLDQPVLRYIFPTIAFRDSDVFAQIVWR